MFQFLWETVQRFKHFVRRTKDEADLREEMDTHLAMLSGDTSTANARQRFGNATRWQEISREVWGWNWLESLFRDAVHGARLLVKSPGFTTTACLSLAIGLGATMGMFSLMNALLFKTLPVPEPRQLWELGHHTPEENDDNFSYRMFDSLARTNPGGIPLFAFGGDYVQVNYGASVLNTPALIVSGDAFRILELKAHIGRLLDRGDDKRGLPSGANCVLSYRLWQSQFHGDPGVVGKHLSIGAQSFTIVGVAPQSFFGFFVGAHSDLILPMAAYAATNPAQPILENPGTTWLNIMCRLPQGIPASEVAAKLNAAYPSIRTQLEPSESAKPDRLYLQSAATGVSEIRSRFSKPLYVLLTMTCVILLIACANLANLLLARSVVRSRELVIRLCIGAKRGRILRQLLTESALIVALGGVVSVPIYLLCTRGLIAFLRSGSDPNVFLDTTPDWLFAAGAAALLTATVLLFGFAPALRALQVDLNAALSENSQRLAAKTSFGRAVVVVQISLSVVLLLGATLLSRSLFDLRTFDPGFRRDHLLIAGVDTTQALPKNRDVVRFFEQLLERLSVLPGVRSAAASVVVPLTGQTWQEEYEIHGQPGAAVQLHHSFENWVTPEYFQTLGTPLLLGRSLGKGDSADSTHVALINQAFAEQTYGPSNPIGRQVYEKAKRDAITIVGIVGDARYRNLRDVAPPTLYRPIAQIPESFGFLLSLNLEVWTNTPAADLTRPIDEAVRHLNNRVSVDFHTFDSLIDSTLLYERLLTVLSVTFAAIGLLLSSIGVYGLSAYSVVRRTPEFGIRMALGATPTGLLKLILADHFRMLGIGLAGGSLISVALTRFLQAWLFGVSPADPYVFSFVLIVVSAFSLCAVIVPARRAAGLNPMAALRCE